MRLSDAKLNALVGDIISVIGQLYVEAGRSVDYVSANLGYSVEFIREYAEKLKNK
jgi:hypothetical protein